ncbi:MAG: aminopeptidase P N-terminal domain-containing protein [Chitinophagaceae bacterium]|nr:aminopeptidase P N-terminal domain-containing protein [Chitinophagaceae bacterium]
MKHFPLDPQLFITNRRRFVEKMKSNSIAVFVSNDEIPSNGDALYPFKQSSVDYRK